MMKLDLWGGRFARACVGAALALSLVACGGGGGGSGSPVVGPGSGASSPSTGASAPVVAADLVVTLSKSNLTNSGTDSITATIKSVDANRVSLAGVAVKLAVNANALVTPASNASITSDGILTDSSGTLTATLTQGSDPTPRPVTLTVTSGSVTRSVTFNVVQSTTQTNPQANDLTLTLSASSIDNSGSKTVTATATAVDQNRNALAGIPVQLSVTDSSAFVISSGNQTDASGQVSGTVNIGQNRLNRQVTVVATSGTLVRSATFQITGTKFSTATPVPSFPPVGSTAKILYTLTDVNSNPLVGATLTVTGNGVASATGTTDINGAYAFSYVVPNAPGSTLNISALAGNLTSTVSVPIPGGSSTTLPTAVTPVATALNLSSNVVTVNSTTDTNNQVTVNAFFRDGNNAPIPNVRVLFGAAGDNGSGSIGAGTNTVLSDGSGTAATTYRPGAVSSPTNGVTLQACYKTTDFATTDRVANCAAAGGTMLTTTLTIVSNPVSISIGTDATITTGAGGLTYVKKFVVLVVDSAGNPQSDVQITPSVDLGGYGKGYWFYNGGTKKWERAPDFGTVGALMAICPNEDLNRNGVIDIGEDINGSNTLDPRKSDVSISVVGSTKTDATGVAVLQLQYPANMASWVKYKITVTAAGVLSPPAYYPLGAPVALPSQPLSSLPSVFDYLYTYAWLPVSADAIAAESSPAFQNSLYGVSASCTDTR